MANPYRIDGPAIVSFSGGRTSGYMLWHILDACDGKLPDDVHVCFANTGKEREETLRFVHDCESHWGVRIRWLEYQRRERGQPHESGFSEVGYNSASRGGEPFERLLKVRPMLPNPVARFCTIELKLRVIENFARSLGWKKWNSAVGLRADELRRVTRAIKANETRNDPWKSVMPLATARVRREHVEAWWRRQPFDLQLLPHEGNCDLCFLKQRSKLEAIIRSNPGLADWWIAMEERGATSKRAGYFRRDESYASLRDGVANSPLLPLPDDGEDFDAECGLWCPADVSADAGKSLNRGCGRRAA